MFNKINNEKIKKDCTVNKLKFFLEIIRLNCLYKSDILYFFETINNKKIASLLKLQKV